MVRLYCIPGLQRNLYPATLATCYTGVLGLNDILLTYRHFSSTGLSRLVGKTRQVYTAIHVWVGLADYIQHFTFSAKGYIKTIRKYWYWSTRYFYTIGQLLNLAMDAIFTQAFRLDRDGRLADSSRSTDVDSQVELTELQTLHPPYPFLHTTRTVLSFIHIRST